jgi:thymidylate kinase
MSSESVTARVRGRETAPVGWTDSLTGRFLTALFSAYERESVRYVVLRNYHRFPGDFGKDVDLVVDAAHAQRSNAIVRRIAGEMGLAVSQRRKRSSHVTYYLLPAPVDGVERGVLLDVRTDLVHQGFCYLPGRVVIDSRRPHDRFYIPSPAIESLALLLHCVIDSRDIRPSYDARLRELGTGDRSEFVQAATAVVGRDLAITLADALERGRPELTVALRGALLRARTRFRPAAAGRWCVTRMAAALDRAWGWVRPRGKLIVLLGPDGSGKTTTSEAVVRRFAGTRIPVSTVYLGAQKPLLPTRRLSRTIRKRLGHIPAEKPVKDVNRRLRLRGLAHIMADKWLRYLVEIRPRLARGEVVVIDRYFYDLRTFPHPLIRQKWFDTLMMALIPEPTVIFILQADPAIIAARKHELTTAETARQIACYRAIRPWVKSYHELPSDGDLVKNVDAVTRHVLEAYCRG